MYGKTLCSVIVLMTVVNKSYAIYCYYCNSANNSACLDVDVLEPELRTRIIPVVNCDSAIPSQVKYEFFCRKIVQTIFHTKKDSEVRVTRGCGWVRHHKECYKDDNSDHLGTVCQCFTHMCNSAEAVDPFSVTLLFLVLAACLYLWR